MSGSADITLGTIGQNAGIANLNVATVPANVRTGDGKAMKAYSEGLVFENMLMSELSQQLSKTMFGGSGDGSSSDASATGTDAASSTTMLGGAGAYASLIPQALSSSIMSDGGVGMAEKFAQELDPALLAQGSTGKATRR